MIELEHDSLTFSFAEVHPQAKLVIDFQRTLRIPDDGNDYPLPPGLGRFPLRHVDDFAETVPADWIRHGGVMLPMYQSEALWLNFSPNRVSGRATQYPFAIKVAAGMINAVTGENWSNGLSVPQNYMVAPKQPWLDGYCVKKGLIRQFVAMPLGSGYSAEEQITGKAEFGGAQIVVYPMKRDVFERRFPKVSRPAGLVRRRSTFAAGAVELCSMDMGLAPGGTMRQEIYDDPFDINDWDTNAGSRCFVHITNSLVWHAVTGSPPPTTPPTSKQYTNAGLPWFDYFDAEAKALNGSDTLKNLKSIAKMGDQKGDVPLPENDSVTPDNIVKLSSRQRGNQVREGAF